MNTKIHLNKRTVVFAFSLFTALAFVSQVQAASIFDIEFPIAELGSCKDKTECKTYCAVADHEQACNDFAAKFGINTAKENKTKINQAVKDGGPGNCAAGSDDPQSACENYCSSQDHMRQCIEYGKSHGLMDGKKLEEAEKVVKALESGAKLPAGCTNEKSCRATCENPSDVSVMRSCFEFADKAGILPPEANRENAEKMFKLIESGKAPFASPRDFRQCENPQSEEVMQKCMKFAEENGFGPPGEDRMNQTGEQGNFEGQGRPRIQERKEMMPRDLGPNINQDMRNNITPEMMKNITPEMRNKMTPEMQKMINDRGAQGAMQGTQENMQNGQYPSSGQNQQNQQNSQYPQNPQTGQYPPGGQYPPNGQYPMPGGQQYPMQSGQYPPSGGSMPSGTSYPTQPTGSYPSGTSGSYTPPSGGSMPPGGSMPAPTSRLNGRTSNAAAILFSQVMGIFER